MIRENPYKREFGIRNAKINIISIALQAFLFASPPHLLFARIVCFYLLTLILPSADLLSAICKPSFIALPDGSGSFTGRQRQLYRTAVVALPDGSGSSTERQRQLYHCRPVKLKMLIEQ